MPYVDGFLVPIPKKNLAAYRRMAQKAGKIWKEYGALEFRECAGDDLAAKGSSRKSPGSRKARRSCSRGSSTSRRAQRDRVNAKIMKDPRIASHDDRRHTV